MNAPSGKSLIVFRIAAVAFALLMIGGYAVMAQKRALRNASAPTPEAVDPQTPATTGPSEPTLVVSGTKSGVLSMPRSLNAIGNNLTVVPAPAPAQTAETRLSDARAAAPSTPPVQQPPKPTRPPVLLPGSKSFVGATIIQDVLTYPPESPKPSVLPAPAP